MSRLLVALLPIVLAGCMSQPPAPAIERGAVPRAAAPQQPSGPGYYTVKRGDTLYRIARENAVDARDLAAWNALNDPGAIKEGQVLRLSAPGAENGGGVVSKPIQTGGGVEVRALDPAPATAPASAASATSSNGVKREPKVGKEPYSDEAYARLNRVADAPKPAAEVKSDSAAPATTAASTAAATVAADAGGVQWDWPLKSKADRGFGDAGSKGLDFGGKLATPVTAAADGKVIYAGEALPGYGKLLILKHGTEFNSVYAHNSKLLVKEGDQVKRGQRIAEMGSTGTDSVKLHFEIRKQGKPVDPAQYLPKR